MSVWSELNQILDAVIIPPIQHKEHKNCRVLFLLLGHWVRLMDTACDNAHKCAQVFWRQIILEIIQYDYIDLVIMANKLGVDCDFLWSLLGKGRETYQLPWELVGHLMALHEEIRPDLKTL